MQAGFCDLYLISDPLPHLLSAGMTSIHTPLYSGLFDADQTRTFTLYQLTYITTSAVSQLPCCFTRISMYHH